VVSDRSGGPGRRSGAEAGAADWLARLYAPDRNADTDAALQAWLDADRTNAAAFDRVTEIWEAIGSAEINGAKHTQGRRSRTLVAAATVAAILVVALVVGGLYGVPDLAPTRSYETAVGEQRMLVLPDDSQVVLNTNSKIDVRYSHHLRRIALLRGEASFQVTKNRARPFIVRASGRDVRALGTSFVVSDVGSNLWVTLLGGRVSIADHSSGLSAPAKPLATLSPGQQWRSNDRIVRTLSPNELEAVTSWERHQVIFDNTPLGDAVAEMNRYTRQPITIEGPISNDQRISGIYRTSDTGSFARAVSAMFATNVHQKAPAQ
jgi:transmembrane sensor